MYLEAGENIYDFAYRLPTNIPSSFNGTYGNINYNTTVVLVVPWWLDDKFKQSITIMKRVDLNDNPMLLVIHCIFLCIIGFKGRNHLSLRNFNRDPLPWKRNTIIIHAVYSVAFHRIH